MTVAELMGRLAEFDQSIPVEYVGDCYGQGGPVEDLVLEVEYPSCSKPTTCESNQPRFTSTGKPSKSKGEHCHKREFVLIS